MSGKQALTHEERWAAFLLAEEDYIGRTFNSACQCPSDLRAIFRQHAHDQLLRMYRTGQRNQQEILKAWDDYLRHNSVIVHNAPEAA